MVYDWFFNSTGVKSVKGACAGRAGIYESSGMMKIDITEILESILETVHSHKLGDGQYARYHACRGAKINAYGCADAANILYSLRSLPRDRAERDAFVAAIRSFQDPASGYFLEGSHHKIHTTAHCTAARELFDALPLYPFRKRSIFGEDTAPSSPAKETMAAMLLWSPASFLKTKRWFRSSSLLTCPRPKKAVKC